MLRISRRRAISWMSALYSSLIFPATRLVNRWSRISRMAWAWISESGKLGHQAFLGVLRRPGGPDQGDDAVEVVQSNFQAL